jgi:uncharacterized membrane protein YkoI
MAVTPVALVYQCAEIIRPDSFRLSSAVACHDHADAPETEGRTVRTRTRWITGGALTIALLGAGAGVAVASGAADSGDDHPITGPALPRAGAAALAYTGGGRVTGTEDGDEESHYEVEVTLDNGKQVDVQLDAQFHVVSSKTDHEKPNDDSGGQSD